MNKNAEKWMLFSEKSKGKEGKETEKMNNVK